MVLSATHKRDHADMPAGRPTAYTPELAARICELISINSIGLEPLCDRHEDLPHHSTVWRWIHNNQEFREMYIRAKESQAFVLEDDILRIGNDASNDYIEYDDGSRKINGQAVNRDRLQFDIRRFLLEKLSPRFHKSEDKSAAESILEKVIDKLVE